LIAKSRVSVRSTNFEVEALVPRRIKIAKTGERHRDPFKHFGTDPPPAGRAVDYTALNGLEASKVWISLDDDSVAEIVEEYQVMAMKERTEADYAAFAMEMFFKRQRLFVQVPSDRKWRTERMIQLVYPTNDECWVAPPCFETIRQEFKFDIRPDCSYWLSLAGFNQEYRCELVDSIYMHKEENTCPYLTIEFKKHGQSDVQARAQAAAAAAIALYNRYLLKEAAMNATKKPWTDPDRHHIRHYVITFVGAKFAIWVLLANLGEDDSWNGCDMKLLYSAMCGSSSTVRQLEKWVNEIHRWGLSEHATSCENDLKILLQKKGVEVSMLELEETGEQS